jgi:Ni,Fe-hydrogenase III component G
VDSNAILAELKKRLGESLLESNRMGRQGAMSAWVETKALRETLVAVREFAGLDWLENFSIAEMHGAFVVSYFLRSTETNELQFIVRAAPMGVKDDEELSLQSVRDLFSSAKGFEDEAGELFGVSFEDESGKPIVNPRILLGPISTFPMRKAIRQGGNA